MVAVQLAGGTALIFDAINKACVPSLFERLKRDNFEEKQQIVRFAYIWFALTVAGAGLAFIIGPWLVTVVAGPGFNGGRDGIQHSDGSSLSSHLVGCAKKPPDALVCIYRFFIQEQSMTSILNLIGRERALFTTDIQAHNRELAEAVHNSRFLVLGGAGSIGQAVTKEIFKRDPAKLHVVDISENNMAELVRDIRSSFGYIDGDFQTFALDIGSIEYDAFFKADGQYDYILNLSALKHVRSEKDPYTLMRMVDVNVFNTDKTLRQAIDAGVKKYFCVSTDKAANPVNMMGASKRIMEMFLMRRSLAIDISTARFANVAFSDGSLLHAFNQRLEKRQPIVAPNDVRRYFVTPKESGELCLMSCIFGANRDIFFPKLSEELHLISFADIAVKYLAQKGLEPVLCSDENEARELAKTLPEQGKWPCLFTSSDTTGEKDFEEFFTDRETLDMERFFNLGIIKNGADFDEQLLADFESRIAGLKQDLAWSKADLVELFFKMIPDFAHKETGKYLDGKM